MEHGNDYRFNESQLDRNIRSILDSPQSDNNGETDIQRLVSLLWEKVTNGDNNSPIENTPTGPTTSNTISNIVGNTTIHRPASASTMDGNSECSSDVITNSAFKYDESISFSTNRIVQFSNQTTTTTTAESTSPSILSDLNITTTRERPTICENLFCCKNDAISKKLTNLSYMEFINQKQEYCKILKNISVKSKQY